MKTKNIICSSISIFYYLLKSRPNKEGKCPICVRVSANGTQTAFSIKRSIHPKNWSNQANAPIGNTAEITELKNYVSSLNTRFFEINIALNEKFEQVTAQMIRERFENKSPEEEVKPLSKAEKILQAVSPEPPVSKSASPLFFDAFKQFLSRENELIGIDTSQTTVGRFDLISRIFYEFLEHKKITPETFRLNDLSKAIVLDFNHYLKTVVKNSHNTAMKKLERLRKFTTYCMDYKLMSENPFYHLRISYKNTKQTKLTEEELNRLIEKDFSDCKRLEFIRDTFVFACYTGLAYADMSTLVRSQVEKQPDGNYVIYKSRIKTDVTASIPVLDIPLEILHRYIDVDSAKDTDLVFNMNTNEVMNRYLKEVAFFCKIEKNLTTHRARHNFGTLITLSQGVPLETVNQMMGYKCIRTTQIYAKLTRQKVNEDMKKLSSRIGRKYKLSDYASNKNK